MTDPPSPAFDVNPRAAGRSGPDRQRRAPVHRHD